MEERKFFGNKLRHCQMPKHKRRYAGYMAKKLYVYGKHKKKARIQKQGIHFAQATRVLQAAKFFKLRRSITDWIKETRQGYKQSDLASQCMHRYKIYIEGSAWSVSEKYILAWNSVTLQAQDIGKAASDFIQQDLKMDHVYEYMFHLLSDYA
ncbi:hypothetical protein Vadar_012085 [Vaccinium darrowii]|uniref:Uncharacterized protein n=1 Tax=Vaccinium darrowii TaxID=229202 RepID=A0ACB7YMC4_9ERIC|nr:hypothetical protein Vadar_012085 [Vaccinium darrowii]